MPRSAVANVFLLAVFGLAAGIAAAPVSAQGLVTTHFPPTLTRCLILAGLIINGRYN
jgi:hypothetical protein